MKSRITPLAFASVLVSLSIAPSLAGAAVHAAHPGQSRPVSAKLNPAIVRAPHAPPSIISIAVSSTHLRSGQPVHADVLTTSNVASVEARIYNYGMPLKRRGVGHFVFQYRVPPLPPFMNRQWPVDVIARNVDGRQTKRTVNVTIL